MHGVCSISRLQLVDVVVILGDLPKTSDFTSCSMHKVGLYRKKKAQCFAAYTHYVPLPLAKLGS